MEAKWEEEEAMLPPLAKATPPTKTIVCRVKARSVGGHASRVRQAPGLAIGCREVKEMGMLLFR